ncbi:hypothetical protein [Bradyrhizobium sp.]|jgi:hypothetical protein|uniref:hypothetical protein n=2 Tax=Bradyrhizobium sp. TaxID=376 RepID=UPI003BBCD18D
MGAEMVQTRFIHAVALLVFSIVMSPVSGKAAGDVIRGKFVLDAIANCENPPVQNFPVHSEGTASLSTDRSARLDLMSNVSGAVQYNAKLGGKPTEAPEGSASLHVVGRHTLQAIRDYPNNIQVVNMTIIGHSCSLKIENRLKPGKHQYTFHTAIGLAYCSKPQVVKAECSVIH